MIIKYNIIPFDTVSGRQHVSIVDQRTTAVELIEIRQTDHPGIFVHARRVAAHDLRIDVRRSTTCYQIVHTKTRVDIKIYFKTSRYL